MVGLSVVLEAACYKGIIDNNNSNKKAPQQVINKSSMMIKPSSSSSIAFNGRKRYDLGGRFSSSSDDFLQYCFLCKHKLLPGKDIYMYRGEMGFCSEECRFRKIVMDKEEKESFKSLKQLSTTPPAAATSASSSSN